MTITIKSYQSATLQNAPSSIAAALADLFTEAIHSIDDSVYTAEEKCVWAPNPPNYERWAARCTQKKPFIAWVEGDAAPKLAGFIELEADGHIDCFYVAKAFQGKGVASALFKHLLVQAKAQNIKTLRVEASKVARPVFEHYGFECLKENHISRGNQTLINYSMQRQI